MEKRSGVSVGCRVTTEGDARKVEEHKRSGWSFGGDAFGVSALQLESVHSSLAGLKTLRAQACLKLSRYN